jgi:hypothetical protein
MAHFCKLKDNVVTKVIEVSDSIATTEENGIEFLRNLFNEPQSNWIQTFQDGTRKHFASRNFTYNIKHNVFIPPKPYPSWILIQPEYIWESPIGKMPLTYNKNLINRDGEPLADLYKWNETNQTWDLVSE